MYSCLVKQLQLVKYQVNGLLEFAQEKVDISEEQGGQISDTSILFLSQSPFIMLIYSQEAFANS